MIKDDFGMHAKAFMGARRAMEKRADVARDGDRAQLRALAIALGEVGNAYFDMWRGCEPGTNEPLEPFEPA